MKRSFLIKLFLLLSLTIKAQYNDYVSNELLLDLNYEEVLESLKLNLPESYIYSNYRKKTISIRDNKLRFLAHFDENWACQQYFISITEEYESVFTARTMKAGYEYSEKRDMYLNKEKTIEIGRWDINLEPFWYIGKISIAEDEN